MNYLDNIPFKPTCRILDAICLEENYYILAPPGGWIEGRDQLVNHQHNSSQTLASHNNINNNDNDNIYNN